MSFSYARPDRRRPRDGGGALPIARAATVASTARIQQGVNAHRTHTQGDQGNPARCRRQAIAEQLVKIADLGKLTAPIDDARAEEPVIRALDFASHGSQWHIIAREAGRDDQAVSDHLSRELSGPFLALRSLKHAHTPKSHRYLVHAVNVKAFSR